MRFEFFPTASTIEGGSANGSPLGLYPVREVRMYLLGLHSIRINDQWRVVFRWTSSGPTDVDIRDYH
jgi:hypothetical protein